jgi:3-methyladenine DNA glycosylase AlkD
MQSDRLQSELKKLADPVRAKNLARFFKTGPGEYGEHDRFYGITVPEIRNATVQFRHLLLVDIKQLLQSPVHEVRFAALVILVWQFEHGDEVVRQSIYDFYLAHTDRINNWDLVDTSTPKIVGAYLFHSQDRRVLYRLVKSNSIWERRIAVLATFYFIDQGQFDDSLKLAELLLNDKHDLIHKAVGWMLREIGKRSESTLKEFLDKHATQMPRTMLRYAIEKFPATERQRYL